MKISMKEFDAQVKKFVKDEMVKEEHQPQGFNGNMAYYWIKRDELKKKLVAEGVAIE